MDHRTLRTSIPSLAEMAYLNTGWAGPSPARVLARMRETAEEEATLGPASPGWLERRSALDDDARAAAERLLNAEPGAVVLTHGTTEGVNIVLQGMTWNPGDELLISSLEHPAITAPAAVLEQRRGVRVTQARIEAGMHTGEMADAVSEAISPRTRLVALSHVLFTIGVRLPAEAIVVAAHQRDVPVLLDGAQTGGHIQLDLDAIGADYYTVSGQKWLLGPTGTGALYVAPARQAGLRPVFREPSGDGTTALPDLELTSGSTVLRAGFAEAIALHLELGPSNVERRTRELGARLGAEMAEIEGVSVLEPASEAEATGLTTLTFADGQPSAIVEALWARHRVAARAVRNPSGVRFSTAPFNDEGDIQRAKEALASVLVSL